MTTSNVDLLFGTDELVTTVKSLNITRDFLKQYQNEEPLHTEPAQRRVRHYFNKLLISDTTKALHVWEHPYYPQFYVPLESLDRGSGNLAANVYEDLALSILAVDAESRITKGLLFHKGPLTDMVKLPFGEMDAVYEEDQQIYVHPKDPYKRIDILPSSRRVVVKINDETIAESTFSFFLLETGLPTRYYLPSTSVNRKYLTESQTTSQCPYKGVANYHDVTVSGIFSKDIVWHYRNPTSESLAIAGAYCFYNEKVDILLDGELQPRPVTKFS